MGQLEERAFRELMARHTPYLWRVLRGMGVSEHDLQDICQETFLVVHRKLDGFQGRSSLRTWICGIALRVASEYRSKAYRRREIAADTPPEQASRPPQHASLERREAWALLDRVLAGLTQEQREVFVLYEIEQLKMREICEILGCPASTCYSRLHAARARVRAAQAEAPEGEGQP